MSVAWTETATAQIQAIHDYLARSSSGYAQALVSRVVDRTEALEGQPLFGYEVLEYENPDIREVFEYPYRILYRVSGADIQVVGVIHSSRRLPRTPPN